MADDLYQYFRVEAREILERLGTGILELESAEPAEGLVGRLLRDAHTLKGAARVVRRPVIADAAHVLEGVLGDYRGHGEARGDGPDEGPGEGRGDGARVRVPQERIGELLELLDRMNADVLALDGPAATVRALPSETAAVEAIPVLRAEPAELGELLDAVAEVATELAAARRSARSLERLRHTLTLLTQQLPAAGVKQGLARSISTELRTALVAVDRQVGTALDRAGRELHHVRAVAERLRLVRADSIFTPLRRAVRDVADAQGKEVAFTAGGGEVRLDGQVLALVHSALLHVVRNAVAHGIEQPADRTALGKAARGEVAFEVVRRGTLVSFACRDDGRGFDLDAVRRKVREGGLLAAEEGDEDELVNALLRGGISTSVAVTEVSGRGIGMDVVRDVVRQLNGTIDIRSDRGRSATVELVVPLSMVSIDGFVVESGGQTVAIPLDCVRRTMRLHAEDIVRGPRRDRVLVEDEMLPFLPLERALASGPAPAEEARPWSAILVAGSDGTAVVGVDKLIGRARIVLRPLPPHTPSMPVVAGVAFDPDGGPRLVLDPDGLVSRALLAGPGPVPAGERSAAVLVIDDSLTTRMLERSILESAGYEVDVVTSGEEALVQARQRSYGLFLVDVEMPGIDGFTFIERIRQDATLHATPAILVSSRGSAADLQRGAEVGAQAYMVKSEFDQDVLLEHIRRLVGSR